MQTTDLRFEHGVLRLDIEERSYLSPGVGAHQFTIPIGLTADWLTGAEGRNTEAALLTADVAVAGYPLASIAPVALALYRHRTTANLRAPLSDEQLVDLGRSGGDIVLSVTVKVALLDPPPGVHPVAETYVDHRIEAHQWNALLDQLGTHVALFLRVPAPRPVPGDEDELASLAKATSRLREARDRLRDGQWENCVATCRLALENLAALVTIPGERSTGQIKPQNRDEQQRWAMLYHATKGIGSAAHHTDGTTDTFHWARADAEAMLVATAALVARYSDASTGSARVSSVEPTIGDLSTDDSAAVVDDVSDRAAESGRS